MSDPNIPPSPGSQSESLSSKYLRKSKFLMAHLNLNIESSSTSRNNLFPNPESSALSSPLPNHPSMTAPAAGSNINSITHATEKTRATKNKTEAAASTPLSPVNHPPPSPTMEIIPPPLFHRPVQVSTSLESATSVASSDTTFTSTPEQVEIQHTPCRLYPSYIFPLKFKHAYIYIIPRSIVTESQIDDAKSLVLDLLGWGVDPEYLVTSGIHPGLIYRIFTELNLRLPANLVLFDEVGQKIRIPTSIPDL